jgi:hypothetical protein
MRYKTHSKDPEVCVFRQNILISGGFLRSLKQMLDISDNVNKDV